jgi:autotransporter translocation and assembly factor TamB
LRVLKQPLGKLNHYLPFGLTLGGTVSGDFSFVGTPSHPDWSGAFTVENGSYQDGIAGVYYTGIAVSATLHKDTLTIQQFKVASGGKLSGNGRAVMAFPLPETLHLELDLDRFQAIRSPRLTARASGKVTVDGAFNKLNAEGNLTLSDVLYRVTQATGKKIEEVDLNAELAKVRGDTTYKGGFLLSKFYKGVSHAIHVEIPGNCWIRGGGLNIELLGDLWLYKDSGSPPSVFGQISVKHGTVQFLNRELTVMSDPQGFVRFDGPMDDPTVDIHATDPRLEQKGIIIDAHVSGSLQHLQFEATGTDNGAEMTPEDVVLALTGLRQLVNPTGQGTSATDQVQGAIQQVASSQLSGAIGRWAGLDVLDYQPGNGGLTDLTGGSLEVGTYVTDRFFIRVLQPIDKDQTSQEVSLEYQILKWLKLRAQQTGRGTSALDLFFQLDWR